ncbi:MAG: DUF1294 domain-containing protein [Oscillospiraceae bacterium]|nr:DUF1294 domain-containing protein [Oscillospiraceae bacterium]
MKTATAAAALLCLGMSLALFITMGLDKRFAKIEHRRVPEKRLFLLAALFGAPGGLLGMYAFRHKTKHWYFVVGFWALTVLQSGLLRYLAYRYM